MFVDIETNVVTGYILTNTIGLLVNSVELQILFFKTSLSLIFNWNITGVILRLETTQHNTLTLQNHSDNKGGKSALAVTIYITFLKQCLSLSVSRHILS